jgi:hypothetical protein
MKYEDLCLVLSKLGIATETLRPMNPNQVNISCPLAPWLHRSRHDHHPSVSIRFDDATKPTLFQCFTCKERGKLWNLVHSYGTLAEKPEIIEYSFKLMESDEPSMLSRLEATMNTVDDWVQTPDNSGPTILNESVLQNFPLVQDATRALRYLDSRDFDTSALSEWGLRFDPRQNRIVFPVRTRDNQLVGAVGRAIFDSDFPKYWNYFGFQAAKTLGGLHLVTDAPRLGVVEGFFDLLRVRDWALSLGFDVVCTWKADASEYQLRQLLDLNKSLYCWYDQDKSGESGWQTMRSRLRDVVFWLNRTSWSDILNDRGELKDMGEFTRSEFDNLIGQRSLL